MQSVRRQTWYLLLPPTHIDSFSLPPTSELNGSPYFDAWAAFSALRSELGRGGRHRLLPKNRGNAEEEGTKSFLLMANSGAHWQHFPELGNTQTDRRTHTHRKLQRQRAYLHKCIEPRNRYVHCIVADEATFFELFFFFFFHCMYGNTSMERRVQ